jgi:23S rRNA pseudouridine2457 synthase
MVSQFISSHDVNLLSGLDFDFPEGTHAIGRLDNHSEGLLLLTTNKKITRLLFQGPKPHTRTYLVQVKNKMTPATAAALAGGIQISAPNGSQYLTSPCSVSIVEDPAPYQHLFDASLLTAVHHRCIRLIRVSIEAIYLGDLPAGQVRELEEADFFKLLDL